MRHIIMGGVLVLRSKETSRTSVRSTDSETSSHMRYWADYIIAVHEI